MNSESFPCIICGKTLYRENENYVAQPRDGVMCDTSGNYGSTVYDPMDGTYLAFNICDPCLVNARDQGRLFERRHSLPVKVKDRSEYRATIWGWKTVDGEYAVWTDEEPEFQAITLTLQEARDVACDPAYRWNAGSAQALLEWIDHAEAHGDEHGA